MCSIFIARGLGPEKYGYFTIFFVFMTLTWQISSSFDTAYLRYAKTTTSEDKEIFLNASIFLKVILGLIVIIIFAFSGRRFSGIFFKNDNMFYMIAFGIISGFFMNFQISMSNLMREKDKFGLFVFWNNINTYLVFAILCLSYLLAVRLDLAKILTIYGASSITIGLVCILFLRREVGDKFLKIDFMNLKKFIFFSSWVLLLTVVVYVLERVDVIFLSRYLLSSDVGIYSAAVQLIMIISVVTGTLGYVFMPKAMTALKSKAIFREYIKDAMIPVALVNLLIVILFFTAEMIVKIVFGAQYIGAVPAFRILCVGKLFYSFYQPLSFIFYALDEPNIRFMLEALTLIIAMCMLMILIPRYGIVGGATAISTSLVIGSVFSSCFLYYRLRNIGMA